MFICLGHNKKVFPDLNLDAISGHHNAFLSQEMFNLELLQISNLELQKKLPPGLSRKSPLHELAPIIVK